MEIIHIDAKKVIETRIAESMGFDKYKQIMETVRKTDVSTDPDFQRTFNAFYRVRRNAEWRKAYYDLFETAKDSNPSFESIIRTIYEATDNIEASFSSKMLATINPDKTIWDRYVMQNLCLNMKGKTKEDSKTWTILIKIICFIKRNSYPSCFFNDEDNPILIIVKTITICQIAVTKRSHHSQKGAEDTRNSRICKCQFC